jgi:hypothetical protein
LEILLRLVFALKFKTLLFPWCVGSRHVWYYLSILLIFVAQVPHNLKETPPNAGQSMAYHFSNSLGTLEQFNFLVWQ